MNNTLLAWAGTIGGIIAMCQLIYGIYKDRKSGVLKKGQAEAAKASLDNAQAEASLPYVQASLKLGNVGEAVAIQQQVINGLREHSVWQDEQMLKKDSRIDELEQRLRDRDEKIEALEGRLDLAEDALDNARQIINELRQTSRNEEVGGPHG